MAVRSGDHRHQRPADAALARAILTQGNYGAKGTPALPSAPASLAVTASPRLFTATIVQNNPPAGVRYVLQYSNTPNFQSPISEELGTTTWPRSLPSQKLYFRVAAKFPASTLTAWVYAGSAAAPALVG